MSVDTAALLPRSSDGSATTEPDEIRHTIAQKEINRIALTPFTDVSAVIPEVAQHIQQIVDIDFTVLIQITVTPITAIIAVFAQQDEEVINTDFAIAIKIAGTNTAVITYVLDAVSTGIGPRAAVDLTWRLVAAHRGAGQGHIPLWAQVDTTVVAAVACNRAVDEVGCASNGGISIGVGAKEEVDAAVSATPWERTVVVLNDAIGHRNVAGWMTVPIHKVQATYEIRCAVDDPAVLHDALEVANPQSSRAVV